MIDGSSMTLFSRTKATGELIRPYVALGVKRAGVEVTLKKDGPVPLTARDFVWIQGNFNWYPRLARQLASMSPGDRPYVILWHTEPLPLPSASPFPDARLHLREIAKILLRDSRATDVYTNARRLRSVAREGLADLVVVSTRSRQEFLAEHGVAAHWVPLGFDPYLGRDLGLKRDVDALFIGTPHNPRHRRSVRYLRRQGVNLKSIGNWNDPSCWGEPRTQLINRAKTFLALQRNPGKLSGARMILGMANKSLVIAEPMYDSSPFIPGVHFVAASLKEMPDVIRHYSESESEREQIAEAGHRFVTSDLKMGDSIARIFALIERSGGPRFLDGSAAVRV